MNINENPILDVVSIRESVKQNTEASLKAIMEQSIKEEMKRIIKEDNSEYEEEEEVDLQTQDVAAPEVDTAEGEFDGEEVIDEVPGEEEELDGMEDFEVGEDTYDVSQNDEAAIKVFKSMSDADQIIVTKQGDTIELEDTETGADYIIDLNEEEEMLGESSISKLNPQYAGGKLGDFKAKLDVPVGITQNRKGGFGAGTGGRHQGSNIGDGDPFESNVEGAKSHEFGTSGKKGKNGDSDPFEDNTSSAKSHEFGTSGQGKVKNADSKPFKKSVNESEEDVVAENDEMEEGLVRTHRSLRNIGKKSDNQVKVPVQQGRVPAVRDGAQLKTETKELVAKMKAIVEENMILKETVKQLRECAQNFYVATQETALMNQKLGKIIQLVSEHSTTTDEKRNIVERFEGHKTQPEIQALYETINKELRMRKPIIENVDTVFNNIITEIKLTEQPTVVNEDVKKSIDLMNRMEGLYNRK